MSGDYSVSAARALINDHCIVRVPVGSRELPAIDGKGFYTWQFYLRRATLDPHCLGLIASDFWSKNEQRYRLDRFQIAGVESAALPLISAIILEGAKRGIRVNAFSIRKERKKYGLRNVIEGTPTNEPVLLVDDLSSALHNSFWHAISVFKTHGIAIYGTAYVLVLKTKKSEAKPVQTSLGKLEIESLFTLDDFTLSI